SPYIYARANPIRFADPKGLQLAPGQTFFGISPQEMTQLGQLPLAKAQYGGEFPNPADLALYNALNSLPDRAVFAQNYEIGGDWLLGASAAAAQRPLTRPLVIPLLIAGTSCKVVGQLLDPNPGKTAVDAAWDALAHLLHVDEISDVVTPIVKF